MVNTQRTAEIDSFLLHVLPDMVLDAAALTPLTADASARRYYRLPKMDAMPALLLMDSPPDSEPLAPYLAVADMLRAAGLSAPAVIAADQTSGLALIEDWGDQTYARVLADAPSREQELYELAVDSLVKLHRSQNMHIQLPRHDGPAMSAELTIFTDWYPPVKNWPAADKQHFLDISCAAFEPLFTVDMVPMLADFHRDNLMWLAHRQGVQRCGLLDFQDAMWGHPLYDLMSLVEDARRDMDARLSRYLVVRYRAAMPDVLPVDFDQHWALLAYQRHMRILGVFLRLRDAYQKPGYMQFLPRVARQASAALSHPALADVRQLLQDAGIDLIESANQMVASV